MRMGAESPRVKVAAIPTGAINLDAAIGIGGIPRGRITEIYGPESSRQDHAHAPRRGQRPEGRRRRGLRRRRARARRRVCARSSGVDIENLLVSQPDTGEQALEIVEILVRSGAVDHASSSTRSRPWCPRRKSKARWATATWDCRRGS